MKTKKLILIYYREFCAYGGARHSHTMEEDEGHAPSSDNNQGSNQMLGKDERAKECTSVKNNVELVSKNATNLEG